MAVSYYARSPADYYMQRQQDQRQQFMNLLNLYLQRQQTGRQQKQQDWANKMKQKQYELEKQRTAAYTGAQEALVKSRLQPNVPSMPSKVKEYAFWVGQGMDESNARKLVYGSGAESIMYPDPTINMVTKEFDIDKKSFLALPPSVQKSYVSEGFQRTRPDKAEKRKEPTVTPSTRLNARKAIANTTRTNLRSAISGNPKLANPSVSPWQSRKHQTEGIRDLQYITGMDIRLPEKYHVYKAYEEQGIANQEEQKYIQNVNFVLEFLDTYPDIKTLQEIPTDKKKIIAQWGLMPVLQKLLKYR